MHLAKRQSIGCGHHVAEEAPDELAAHLIEFCTVTT
jgi:pimeloyl-ACP methyl ester carboxylesterase